MNMSAAQAAALIGELLPLIENAECDVVICPPYLAIPKAGELLKKTPIGLGAQNVHWAESGAFTGEVSAPMLKEAGVSYAIIGHSERRQYFGETDESVNARAKAALQAGLTPIICVGESLDERESGMTEARISAQTKAALADIERVENVVIAYEPIWAIGTGRTASSEQANAAIGCIRAQIAKLYGAERAENVRILYGGSMNSRNAAELIAQPEIDGGLIGGASLNAADFAQIVNCCR